MFKLESPYLSCFSWLYKFKKCNKNIFNLVSSNEVFIYKFLNLSIEDGHFNDNHSTKFAPIENICKDLKSTKFWTFDSVAMACEMQPSEQFMETKTLDLNF